MAISMPISETSPLLGHPEHDNVDHDTRSSPGIRPGNKADQPRLPTRCSAASHDEEQQRVETIRNYEGIPELQKRMKYIFPALAVGVFLAAGDQTITVSSYGTIGSELKALNSTSWIATAYLLTVTSFQPLYGKLSDIFGRKQALLFAYAIFGVGALLCGLARTMNELIAARALAGVGGGGMTTVVSILLSDIVPLRSRGTWQGYINIVYATGAGIGAPLGGLLADSIGWRWAFLGQVPMCLISILSVSVALKLPERESVDWKTKLRRVDFLGAFVLVSAVFTLLLGLDHGSNVAWRAHLTLGALSASAALFVLFMVVEMKVADEPFAPGHIVFERSLLACYLCNFFSFAGWLAVIFYVPLFYQAVDGLGAAQAGIRLLPGILAGVTGSLCAGALMQRTGKYYWLTVSSYAGLTAAMIPIILYTGLLSTSTWGVSVGLAIGGFSNGIGVTSSLIALLSNTTYDDQAVATACAYLFRSLGSVVGVSLSAMVVQQFLRSNLGRALQNGHDAEEITKRVRESLSYINTLEPDIRSLVRECYGDATQASFILNMCVASGAMFAAFWIREKRLSG